MSHTIPDPAADWATDFDHADPRYNQNAPAIWASLRGQCPVAHTARYGGAWLPLTYDHVREIAYDTTHFTSEGVIVGADRPTVPRPAGAAPPITSDPPFHTLARRLLLPAFSPKRIALLEDDIRLLCRARLDALCVNGISTQVIDVATGYAQHIPVGVISKMIGLPPEDEALFSSFLSDILEDVNLPPEQLSANWDRLDAYLDVQIEDHRRRPRDDLISFLIDARLDDRPLEPQHIRGSIALMLLAGIDTTWSVIGSSLWHLASHPGDLQRFHNDPSVRPLAVEEFLRAYAPVTMARLVVDDYDFHGHPMKKNDWVLLPFPAANRDPAAFEAADEVKLDRAVNRHAAFGLGIHRCIGSNLARLELKIALEEFTQRFPAFELADPDAVVWSVGQIRGPRRLEVRVTDSR
jgi:cytochrome P450